MSAAALNEPPPRPWHRWAKNEQPDFDLCRRPDHCIVCGTVRWPLTEAGMARAEAACPGPQRKDGDR